MSALVETMFSVREKPWHGQGTIVQTAPTSADALRMAGLDWRVEARPIYDRNGNPIEGYVANTRDSDNSVLGIVTNRYSIIQNSEAFAFTDAVVGDKNGVHYETAGSLRNGKQVWLLAKMPSARVAGDDVEPYLCFTNTHDGSGAVRVCMTPVRVVCNNTLNLALSSAKRQWSTIHKGKISQKVAEAQATLELAQRYMVELDEAANKFANVTVRPEWLEKQLKEWFPMNEDDSNCKKSNINDLRDGFMYCYMRPDIAQFFGTAWGVINAASDMAHMTPQRKTETFAENNFQRVIYGAPLLDMVVKSCSKLAKV